MPLELGPQEQKQKAECQNLQGKARRYFILQELLPEISGKEKQLLRLLLECQSRNRHLDTNRPECQSLQDRRRGTKKAECQSLWAPRWRRSTLAKRSSTIESLWLMGGSHLPKKAFRRQVLPLALMLVWAVSWTRKWPIRARPATC